MLSDPKIIADPSVIRDHLTHNVRRWHELGSDCLLEVRLLTSEDQATVKDVSRYRPTPEGIAQACEHIAIMNAHRLNAYIVVNPISAAADIKAGRGATDADIIASFFHWADADDAQAAANIRSFVGPRPTYYVLTGTQPCARPHVYWELEEPTRNLTAWNATQKAIAATLKTDASVVNASRIMRVAGTVNWPKPKKLAKGYAQEVTELHIHADTDRPLVSSDRMARAFIAAPQAEITGTSFQIDTGGMSPALDREQTYIRALSGKDWHDAVIRLVGSYVSKGLSDSEIHALTQPLTLSGYTGDQTAREVQTAIDGARRKGWTPDSQATQIRDLTASEIDAIPPLMFKPWQAKDLAAIPVPEFVYSDFYARKYTSVTLAAPKVGKSMLALAEALDMATGRGFLTGIQRDPLIVVYYNAEDDQDVMDARVAALLTHYGIPQDEIDGRFYPVSGVTADDFYMMSGDVPVINEALFVGLEKFCETARADVLIFDPLQDLSRSGETNEAFRLLGQRLRRMANKVGVALGLIHHTRKVAAGITPSIDDMRGGGALRGTARFNRILVGMTEEEAAKAGIQNHRHFMRIGDMESNLAPPSSEVNQWYQKISVLTPNGHYVGAIEKWDWPDAFDGLSEKDAARVRNAIMTMPEPPLESIRSPNRWAGIIVAETLGLDIADKGQKARVASLIKGWLASGVLAVESAHNPRAGRPVAVIVAGPNNPLSEI